MTKLDFFKKYLKAKGLEKDYAFGVVTETETKLVFFDGTETKHLMYKGSKCVNGQLYSVSSATCGHESDGTGLCFVGKPCQSCIDKGLYSENKCAIYFHNKVNLEDYTYHLSFEELKSLFSF